VSFNRVFRLGVRESDLGCEGEGDRILDRVGFFIVDELELLIEDVVLRIEVVLETD